MVHRATLHTDLEAFAGPEGMQPAGAYIVDSVMPRAALKPRTPQDAASVVKYANERGLAIIAQGGRRHIGLGNEPARYDIALDMRNLDEVVDYEPEDLTITVQTGMSLGTLRRTTAEANQMVPFDPIIPDEATVGGVVAADAWGPARMSLGSARDFTIGMRVITGDGLMNRAGGRVVKNVAGYDLCKLYIGSLGTLGIITETAFKTVPLPKATDTLAFVFPSAGAACRVPNEGLIRGLTLRSAEVTRADSVWVLQVHIAGSPTAVETSADCLRELASAAGGEETDGRPPAAARRVISRVSLLPSTLPAFLANLPAHIGIAAYPTLGVARISGEDIPALTVHSIIESCPPDLKSNRDVFGPTPDAVRLMRAVKAQFDPNNVLAPGRFSGRL